MVATARRLTEEGFVAMPHVPARLVPDAATLDCWLRRYRDEAGVAEALVLAGGTGTRLYPASRSDRPKQFLNLLGDADAAADAPGESGGDAGVDDADADDADADG